MTGFQPTGEQEKIRERYLGGGPLAVTAGAGTGKTSTLVLLGEAKPARVRYIAFNKSVALEAERKFPNWVRPSTAHSLAWQAVRGRFRDRMDNQRHMPAKEVARILKVNDPLMLSERTLAPHQVARLVMETVKHFCYSAADEPNEWHAPHLKGIDSPGDKAVLRDALVPLARKAWEDLCRPAGQLRYGHDYYLKFWQLSGAVIDADVLFVDECQDLNPVLEAIIARQDAQVVAVGDANQQLYSWRGATDALDRLGGGNKLALSQSFRFGPAIAREANKWLTLLDADLRLSGTPSVPSRLGEAPAPRAILARSNAGVMKQVIEQVSAGRKVAMPSPRPGVPGGAEIEKLAKAAISLKQGRGTDHPELMAFQTWAELQDYSRNDPGGEDLAVLVSLIDEHTPEKILSLTARLVEERYAEVVVSTVHKCVHPDTLVETPQGLTPIRAIPESGSIATPLGERPYYGKFTKAVGPVLTLRTKRGYELTVSPEHGLTVWRGEHVRATADEIRPGDWLRLRLGVTTEPQSAPRLPVAPSARPQTRQYAVPATMTPELGEFLGLMVADGSLYTSGKGFRLAKRHRSVVDRFAYLVKELFGYSAKLGDINGTPAAEVNSVFIVDWLSAIGGTAPNAKYVPAVILASPLPVQKAFLRGLFEDGTVNLRGQSVDHVHWENRDPDVARTVQTMLLRLGIVAARRFHHGVCSLYLYSRHAERFAHEIGFVADEKTARLRGASFGQDQHTLIPVARDELRDLEPWMGTSDTQNARARGYLSRRVAEQVAAASGSALLAERLRWHYEPVTEIEAGEAETICVTVPDGSRFLQNGFDGWNSKGREWESVLVTDFREPKKDPETGVAPLPARDQMMAAYVAVTRAKVLLDRGPLSFVDHYLTAGAAA